MQTHFSDAQLQDPEIARSNAILRACVHCGMCTATCPTYQVLGNELDSPRGRIYLIKEMLESGRDADARVVTHIDRCLGCLSCTTTCPSGVDYMHLLDHARVHIERSYQRPLGDRMLRWVLARVIPSPKLFRISLLGAKLARPFARFLPDARLRAMIAMAPARIPAVSRNDDAQTFPAQGIRKWRVGLMTGCAQKALNTDINDATLRVLTRMGCEVVIPKGFSCCGALAHHMGRHHQSHPLAADTVLAFDRADAIAPLDAIIINTSGCGTTIKDYGVMFQEDPLAPKADRVSKLAMDVTEFLAKAGLETVLNTGFAPGLRVAYHSACSLQHGQKIKKPPVELLKQAGFEVVEPLDSHLCCGSAGTYNLLQPTISADLQNRKVTSLMAKKPDIIAAGNIGCMMQIGAATETPVVHTIELLDWASGGPKPPALGI